MVSVTQVIEAWARPMLTCGTHATQHKALPDAVKDLLTLISYELLEVGP